MITKMLFNLGDVMVVTQNNIINTYYQVDTSNIWVMIKDWMTCLTPSHIKLLNNIA